MGLERRGCSGVVGKNMAAISVSVSLKPAWQSCRKQLALKYRRSGISISSKLLADYLKAMAFRNNDMQ